MNELFTYIEITFAITWCYYTDFISIIAGWYFKLRYGPYWSYKRRQIHKAGIRYIELLPKPFSCVFCTSFWFIGILSLLNKNSVLNSIFSASICSCFAWFCYGLLEKLKRVTE